MVRGFVSGELSDSTFAAMRSWGANVVRLQVAPLYMARDMHKPFWDAWPEIVNIVADRVERAGRQGLKVVVDMHEPPVPGSDSGPENLPAFWARPDLSADCTRAWADLARRLLPLRRYIWGYDLFNEPLDRRDEPDGPHAWYPLALEIVRAIRAVDPNVWIIYEPGPGAAFSGFEKLRPLPDARVIYSAHFYYPMKFTGQGIDQSSFGRGDSLYYPGWVRLRYWDAKRLREMVQPAVDFQQRYHVPIYVGEFSVVRWAPKGDAVRWLRDAIGIFESNGWSWTYHAFREFNGWNLEQDETFWTKDGPPARLAPSPTVRAQVIRQALSRNGSPTRSPGPNATSAGAQRAPLQSGSP